MRETVAEGKPLPLAREKAKAEEERTFENAAAEYIARTSPTWRNAKHSAQWPNTLRDYASPIAKKHVAEITPDDGAALLAPMWITKHETASRVRGRIKTIVGYAAMNLGWLPREQPNPAAYRHRLEYLLPATKNTPAAVVIPHAALPYKQAADFMTKLQEKDIQSSHALQLLIYTAARTGEVIGARWAEFDLEEGIWTIPSNRTKSGREHVVPLAVQAIELLNRIERTPISDYVFASANTKAGHISDMTMKQLMKRIGAPAFTPHGFRSTFRDWGGDKTTHEFDVAEAAPSHVVGGKTVRAYRRGNALEKRRKMMQDWADFLTSSTDKLSGTVSVDEQEKS